MKIYLAGGVSGNLNPAWKRVARGMTFKEALIRENFWRGGEGHKRHIFKDIYGDLSPVKENEDISGGEHNIPEVYRSDIIRGGFSADENILGKPSHNPEIQGREIAKELYGGIFSKPYILESFYYCNEDTEKLIPYFGDFMLDSGAFTFIENKGMSVNWEDYLERYADFIIRNKVKKFFELDIDHEVGYGEVKRLRRKLERMTGRRSIPVWHKNRGAEEFEKMCEEYEYVSVGSNSQNNKFLNWFIKTAHRSGARIHGLGYTQLKGLPKYHFDSVDSTAWTTGNRFGYIYKFDGKTMTKTDAPKGSRIKDPRRAAMINYIEWVKFQRWAEVHL